MCVSLTKYFSYKSIIFYFLFYNTSRGKISDGQKDGTYCWARLPDDTHIWTPVTNFKNVEHCGNRCALTVGRNIKEHKLFKQKIQSATVE